MRCFVDVSFGLEEKLYGTEAHMSSTFVATIPAVEPNHVTKCGTLLCHSMASSLQGPCRLPRMGRVPARVLISSLLDFSTPCHHGGLKPQGWQALHAVPHMTYGGPAICSLFAHRGCHWHGMRHVDRVSRRS